MARIKIGTSRYIAGKVAGGFPALKVGTENWTLTQSTAETNGYPLLKLTSGGVSRYIKEKFKPPAGSTFSCNFSSSGNSLTSSTSPLWVTNGDACNYNLVYNNSIASIGGTATTTNCYIKVYQIHSGGTNALLYERNVAVGSMGSVNVNVVSQVGNQQFKIELFTGAKQQQGAYQCLKGTVSFTFSS